MVTLKNLKQTSLEELICLQEDSPVNRSASQESGERKTMTATSGRICSALLRNVGQSGLLVKMLLESSTWHSKKCALTWKAKGMKSGRSLFQLVPSTLPIEEIGYGLLPTPSASDHKGGRAPNTERKGAKKSALRDVLNQIYGTTGKTSYPHPTLLEAMMGYPVGHTELKPSEMQ